ncbi:MAG TPA: preprotein translocase subunit SecY, partial [Clostridiales bacterium]|nr:preprotein translocase subunit SecY [Clostridiales bacterium]
GALVTVWIGERITDYGVSNGISMLIFAGILATAGIYFIDMIRGIGAGGDEGMKSFWRLFAYIVAIIVIFALIVCVENAERKVKVQYAKQVKGRKMMGGQSTEIPMKVNANGVMPLIFAFSIVSFPELIFTMLMSENNKVLRWWQKWMGTQSWVYMIVLCLLIFFFAFFYSQIQFNPEDVSKSIQQNGGFIQGIRP